MNIQSWLISTSINKSWFTTEKGGGWALSILTHKIILPVYWDLCLYPTRFRGQGEQEGLFIYLSMGEHILQLSYSIKQMAHFLSPKLFVYHWLFQTDWTSFRAQEGLFQRLSFKLLFPEFFFSLVLLEEKESQCCTFIYQQFYQGN